MGPSRLDIAQYPDHLLRSPHSNSQPAPPPPVVSEDSQYLAKRRSSTVASPVGPRRSRGPPVEGAEKDSRAPSLRRSYSVKWQGYSHEHNERVDEANIHEALAEEFERPRSGTLPAVP